MIIIIALATTSILSHNYHFFFVVRTSKIYSLSNFQVYNTVLLTVITMLHHAAHYIPELVHLITEPISPSFPHPRHLVTTTLLSVPLSSAFLDSTYK